MGAFEQIFVGETVRRNLLLRAVMHISDSGANFVTEICPQLSGKIPETHRCLWLT